LRPGPGNSCGEQRKEKLMDPLWTVPLPYNVQDPLAIRDRAVERSIEAHFRYVEHMTKMRDIIARLHNRERVPPG